MPGIIVSRPVFNTLFKLAHEQGLSINAFLTRLLESSGQGDVAQASAGGAEAAGPADDMVNGAEVPTGEKGTLRQARTQEDAAAVGQGERADAVGVGVREVGTVRVADVTGGRVEPVAAQVQVAAPDRQAAPPQPPAAEPPAPAVTTYQNGSAPHAWQRDQTSANGQAAATGSGANGESFDRYTGGPAASSHVANEAASGPVPGQPSGTVWDRVVSMAGKKFATSRGKKFSYKITGEYVIVKESGARIPRSQFHKAEQMWPVSGPSRLVGVYAPSVVWSIMKEVVGEGA